MALDIRERLKELDLELPAPAKAVADYVPALRVGDLIYVSGQLPLRDGHLIAQGPVRSEADLDRAQAAARQCVLNGLAAVDSVLEGDWSKFQRIVRLAVYVAGPADFHFQHKVANGGSELLGQLFGDTGQHARAAVGVASLPLNASVEAELLVHVR